MRRERERRAVHEPANELRNARVQNPRHQPIAQTSRGGDFGPQELGHLRVLRIQGPEVGLAKEAELPQGDVQRLVLDCRRRGSTIEDDG